MPTATASSSTGARLAAAWPTRAGRTPGTASTSPTARSPSRRSRSPRCRPTSTLPTAPGRSWRGNAGDNAGATAWRKKAKQLKRDFNERFWLDDKGWYAIGLDAREATDRRAHLEHRALPVDRDRRQGEGCLGGAAPDVAGDVQRLGYPDAGQLDGRLQPDELPQRLGLAARQRDLRRRAHALRLHRAGPAGDRRDHRCGGGVRLPAAGAVLRLRPGRVPRRRCRTRHRARRRPGRQARRCCCCTACSGSPRRWAAASCGARPRCPVATCRCG